MCLCALCWCFALSFLLCSFIKICIFCSLHCVLCPFDFKVRNYSHYNNTDLCVVFHSAEWGVYYPLPTHRIIARNDFLLVHFFIITARAPTTIQHNSTHSVSDTIAIIIYFYYCYEHLFSHRHKECSYTHRPHTCGQRLAIVSLACYRSHRSKRESVDQKWLTENLIIFAWFAIPWRKWNRIKRLFSISMVAFL